mmetsp:Transcript_8799/g.22532  ORF Transcript_8799/g.22532 Transcript_8799/m.22532 type:complete len:140 (-) Transcript_8799:94-513(-)
MGDRKQTNVDDINDIYDSFDNAEMLFMSEVEHILTETLQSRKEETNNAYEFGPVVEKAYNYAKRFSTFTNTTHPQHIRQQLSDPAKYGFQPHEITLLGNLCPDNQEEATHLIPSMKQHMEEGPEKIDNALAEIQKFCRH